jgi:mono/diheme cytochrome c family protein
MKHLLSFVSAALLLPGGAPALQAQAPDGQAIYRQECKSCHGVTGVPPARAKEQYAKIKALGEDGFVARLTTDSIMTILRKGIGKDMKSFTGKLSESEMAAVAAYVKELAERRKARP